MSYESVDFDWPDIPWPDFPDLPTPGEVVENLLETLAEAMRADGIGAIKSVIKLLSQPGPIDFSEQWLRLLFSQIFGLALVLTIFVSTLIVFVESLRRRMEAVDRMITVSLHAVKMFPIGYLALSGFALLLWISQITTELLAGIIDIGNPTGGYDSLSSVSSVGSLFAAFGLNGLLMASGGLLYTQLHGFEYLLAPLALASPLAYSIKPLGMWGERFWKLFVSFVFAVMFTKPFVILVLAISAQVIANVPTMPPTVQNIFLLWAVWLCALTPMLIMLLAYVGYTIQIGKSKSEVEGKVEATMSEAEQNRLYSKQTAERVRQATADSAANLQTRRDAIPPKERVLRDYFRTAKHMGVQRGLDKASTALVAKTAATAAGGPVAGIATSVAIGALGAAKRKSDEQYYSGKERR